MPKDKAKDNKKLSKEGFRFSPIDFLGRSCHIELEGNTSLNLEGSKGVLEYSTECIRVSVENFIVSVSGSSLCLKCISPSALTITGSILNIGFSD